MKPPLDITRLRAEDTALDTTLIAAESQSRSSIASLSATAPNVDNECFGVWVEHNDEDDGPPGTHFGQCSRGCDCRFPGKRERHSEKINCAELFNECPRCDCDDL